MRTRYIFVLAAIVSLALSQSAAAKTGPVRHNEMLQAGVTGTMRMMTEILSAKRPVGTPLAEWAKATTDRARNERLSRHQQPVPAMTDDEMVFSRDRD